MNVEVQCILKAMRASSMSGQKPVTVGKKLADKSILTGKN